MNTQQLTEFMTFRKDGQRISPLTVFEVNGNYILGVYQGALSDLDILIKYRPKSWRILVPHTNP